MSEHELDARVEAVLSIAAQASAQHERDACVSPAVYDALKENRLFGILAPRTLGGDEIKPWEAYEIWETVARYDSATSWILSQSNGGLMLSSFLPPSGIAKIYPSGQIPIFAGANFPVGQGRREKAGYSVSGKMRYVSGCEGADWLFMPFKLDEDPTSENDAGPVIKIGFFKTEDATIHRTWDVLGMRGTGSHDVSINDVFISADLVVSPNMESKKAVQFSGLNYRLAAWIVIHGEAVAALGVANAAIADLISFANRVSPDKSKKAPRDKEAVQLCLGSARAQVDAARLYLHNVTKTAYYAGEDELDLQTRGSLQLAACLVTEVAVDVTSMIYDVVGGEAIWTVNRFERHLRDVNVVKHHAQLARSRYASVGRVMMNMPSENPLLI